MKQELYDAVMENPVIAAVKDDAGVEACIQKEDIRVIFVLYGEIVTIADIVERLKAAGKFVVVHLDLSRIGNFYIKVKSKENWQMGDYLLYEGRRYHINEAGYDQVCKGIGALHGVSDFCDRFESAWQHEPSWNRFRRSG